MELEQRVETIPAKAQMVLIGFNPKAGSTASESPIHRLSQELESRGFHVQLETDIDRIVSETARLNASGDLRVVVSAGGDGTASLIANRLPADIPMAVFPLGTENLLAKHLGTTSNPKQLADWIAEGLTVRLDAGLANGNLFLVVASCGFDAEVVRQLHGYRKGNINRLSYTWPILRSIANYSYPKMRIRCDGGSAFTARWAFAFNVPQYALQLPIVHDANCTDGRLDLCSFRGGSLWNGLMYVGGIILRLHRKWKDTVIAQFDSLEIESDHDVPYQLDGDPGGHLPLKIKVVPQRFRVVVSQKWLQSNSVCAPYLAKSGSGSAKEST